jgi:hypothetical protein
MLQLRKCDGCSETTSPQWEFGDRECQEVAMQMPSFAYSLCQVEEGWRWSVYDEEGVTVAGGADVSRDRAQQAVELTLRGGSQQVESHQALG